MKVLWAFQMHCMLQAKIGMINRVIVGRVAVERFSGGLFDDREERM